MGKYQGYEKYKDSGFEWLGKIPEHWKIKRFKFLLQDGYEGLKIGPFGSQIKSERLSSSGNYKVYGQENIINQDFSLGYRYLEDDLFKELSMYEIKANDLLITMMGTSGRCYIVPNNFQQGIMDSHLIRLRISNNYNLEFIRYLIDESEYVSYQVKILGKGSIMHGLNSTIIKNLVLIIPPLNEQQKIAQFLDYKTKQIDDLIAKKEALLEKLDEKRTALISHAVTKGLDPNVPMQDSGIEWLGEIPKHWEIMAVKRKAQVRSGVAKGRKLDKQETVELPYLRVANVQDGYIDISDISYIEVLHNEIERYSLQDGDILMNEGGDNDKLGRGAVWKAEIEPCLHQNHVFAVRPNNKKLSSWIALLTSSSYAKFYFFSRAKQSTNLASISSTNIKLFPVILPPDSERKKIINHISNIKAKIDEQKAKIQKAIELLKEYRTALITNAVTGKIDVRQVPIP